MDEKTSTNKSLVPQHLWQIFTCRSPDWPKTEAPSLHRVQFRFAWMKCMNYAVFLVGFDLSSEAPFMGEDSIPTT